MTATRVDLTLEDYLEQRRWDAYRDDEDAQSNPREAERQRGAVLAYLDVLNFLQGNYRPDYLEAVQQRLEARRQAVGP